MNSHRYLSGQPRHAQPARRSPASAIVLAWCCIATPAVACCCVATPAAAQRLPITPANSQIGYTVYGLGLVPIHGAFQQFDGAAVLDSAHPLACTIDVTIQVASLRMANPIRQHQALAPDMLAAGRYPTMHFNGACQPVGIIGFLTMHGATRPLTLQLRRTSAGLTATGSLRRQDFGIAGMPRLVGSQVRIKLTTPAPVAFRAPP